MGKQHTVAVKKSFREQTPDEQIRFEQAVDCLIGELVAAEMRRLELEKTSHADCVLPQQQSDGGV